MPAGCGLPPGYGPQRAAVAVWVCCPGVSVCRDSTVRCRRSPTFQPRGCACGYRGRASGEEREERRGIGGRRRRRRWRRVAGGRGDLDDDPAVLAAVVVVERARVGEGTV